MQDLFIEFDQKHENNPMYNGLRMYLQQVIMLLQFVRATQLNKVYGLQVGSIREDAHLIIFIQQIILCTKHPSVYC